MATGGLCVEPSEKECTVCHEHLKVPKLLPCGHLLCRHCLVTWLNSQLEAKCPLCRSEIVDPKEHMGRSFEDVADSFPTDLAMAALVEADRLLAKQHVCCVCVNVAAVSMCLNCGDMFCQPCSTVHKKQSLSKHHKVKDLTSLTPEILAADCPATCAVHDDKMSEVYCPKHGASVCLLCAFTDHRQCPDVTKLETKMEESSAVLAELAAMLSKGETDLEQAIAQLDKGLQDLDQRTKDEIAQMEATCDRLESLVKACRHHLKELSLTSSSDAKAKLNDGKTILLKRRGRLTSHKNMVQRVQGFSRHGSFGDMTTSLKTRVWGLDRSCALPSDVKVGALMTSTIDPQAVTRIEQELSQLGQPKVHINEIDSSANYTYVGVVTNRPDTLTLPDHFYIPDPAVLCVSSHGLYVFGQEKREQRPVLYQLPVGSRVGLAVHIDTSLHLYVDGKHQRVVAPDIPRPCYFMFNVIVRCKKITALPVKPIS